MSLRYKGAVISATPPTVSATSPNAYGTAKGVWTLQQQMQYEGAGTWPNPFAPVYIEDVFSTYLYTGNGSTQTITNNIDLSGKGGLTWIKSRGVGRNHRLTDTVRGATKILISNTTDAEQTESNGLTAFNNNGFSVGDGTAYNSSSENYASWTFRKAEKFFDVVTFTQSGTSGYQTINHNLGSVPGVIIIKGVGQADGWFVYHRSIPTQVTYLNQTNAAANFTLSNSVTSTTFNFNLTDFGFGNGATYVAYLFAHNAGGFGDAGSDNVITCGSYTGTGSAQTLSLGYEPQWVLIKQSSGANDWNIWDNMRGLVVGGTDAYLQPNTSNAENSLGAYDFLSPTATGLTIDPTSSGYNYVNTNGATYIYIAIRRGPMKTPTTGTSVFTPDAAGNNASAGGLAFDAGFPVDWYIRGEKSGSNKFYGFTRLTGNEYLETTSTAAGATSSFADQFDSMTGIETTTGFDFSGQCAWLFRRAPGFFDVVATSVFNTGTDVNHNLGVTPELVIAKARNNSGGNWMGAFKDGTSVKNIALNVTTAAYNPSLTWSDYFTSTTFNPTGIKNAAGGGVYGTSSPTVIYLFATVAGVSKVGSYTGTGTTLQVNCGFTGGSRFVLIKRTDSTGDWYVWDSARGIVAGNDPYLLLNSTAAEVTNTDYVDTFSSGFEISSTAPAAINANGGTFIFLAIA